MKFLTDLCQISSESRHEQEAEHYICEYIEANFPEATVELDKSGNIYVTKNTLSPEEDTEGYPTIVAHYDQVQNNAKADITIFILNDYILGYDFNKLETVGPGFDDKTGCYIAIKMLEKFPKVKCCFFTGEEIGCLGSNSCDIAFFSDSNFVVQCDRRGNSDFINSIGGVNLCSKEFLDDIDISTYGYTATTGMSTDVATLRRRGVNVACCNMSCGYYNPHTKGEVQSIKDLNKCMELVEHIFKDCNKKYEMPEVKYPSYGSYGYYGHYGKGTTKTANKYGGSSYPNTLFDGTNSAMAGGVDDDLDDEYYNDDYHAVWAKYLQKTTEAEEKVKEESKEIVSPITNITDEALKAELTEIRQAAVSVLKACAYASKFEFVTGQAILHPTVSLEMIKKIFNYVKNSKQYN